MAKRPAKSGKKQDGKFQPGQSGNPAGKPRGTLNKVTLAMEALLEGEGEALTRKVIEKATAGDAVCLRLCFERLYPVRRGRPISVELPNVETADDVAKAQGAILAAVATGDLTPDEGQVVSGILEGKRKAIETAEIERRVAALERGTAK